MTMWKDDILTKAQFEYIQQEVDAMKVPANVGGFPTKYLQISVFYDQWKNDLYIFYSVFKGTSACRTL